MLIPKFRCIQDDNFVKVEIVLSALCKVAEAQFDIVDNQFTFSCSPYFLRLTFPCAITEEKGERATYDLESNILTVFVPKLNTGEDFPGLDFPNQLLATSNQRKEMGLELVSEVREKKNDDEDDEEEQDEEMDNLETEFDQMLQVSEQEKKRTGGAAVATATREDESSIVYYGFNNQFSKFFIELDEDLTKELLDVPTPDSTQPLDRKKMRKDDEDAHFDEGAFLFSMNDEEGEIENEILPFKPWYVQCFEEALISAGRRNQQQSQNNNTNNDDDAAATTAPSSTPTGKILTPGDIGRNFVASSSAPTNDAITSKDGTIWEGNVEQIKNEPKTTNEGEADSTLPTEGVEKEEVQQQVPVAVNDDEDRSSSSPTYQQKSSRNGLAFTVPPPRTPAFTMDESTTLQTIPKKNFFIHSEALVCWQLCDLLAATVYDLLTTQGQGNVESSWTITKLSTCLSWLDSPQSAKEFADTFCRRVLTFPLHRHFGLALRCLRDVSLLLLSGPKTIVKFLLYTKSVIDSCDTSGSKHALSALYINPMLSWLTAQKEDIRERLLIKVADELHGYVVRGEVLQNSNSATQQNATLVGSRRTAAMMVQVVDKSEEEAKKNQDAPWRAELQPLAWTSLKLPFSEELMAEVAE